MVIAEKPKNKNRTNYKENDMEKLSMLEEKIVQEEYKIINAEFKKAMDIINKAIAVYGKTKFRTDENFTTSIFKVSYFGGYSIEKAHFGIGSMPESFQKVVSKKAISDFMDNIDRLNDLTSEL